MVFLDKFVCVLYTLQSYHKNSCRVGYDLFSTFSDVLFFSFFFFKYRYILLLKRIEINDTVALETCLPRLKLNDK